MTSGACVFITLLYLLSVPVQLQAQTILDLKTTLHTARNNNRQLKTQQLDIGISEADVITARLRPNLLLNNQSLQLANSHYFPRESRWYNSHNRQIWWQLTKKMQWPGQRSLKIAAAQQQVEVARNEFVEAERDVLSEVALKWLDVWTAQKQLDILLLAKTNIDSIYRINQYRYEKQVITQTDLLRAQLLSRQFELQIRTAAQDLTLEMRNLRLLLGIQDSIRIDTSDSFGYYAFPSADSLVKVSAIYRGDVMAARSTVELAENNIKLQKRLAFPVPELGTIYNPQNSLPYIGIFATAELPLWSRNQGEIHKSFLQRRQAVQSLEALQYVISTEISNAYSTYLVQRENINAYQSILSESQKVLENVRYAYLRGGTSIIDYLEAQRSWLDTRQQYYEAYQKYRESYIQVLYTTGYINQLAQ